MTCASAHAIFLEFMRILLHHNTHNVVLFAITEDVNLTVTKNLNSPRRALYDEKNQNIIFLTFAGEKATMFANEEKSLRLLVIT